MIETERLLVRPWADRDRAPFAAMGQDARVMATLGPLLTRVESDGAIDRQIAAQARDGHCFWAVERRVDRAFLGFCGLVIGADGTSIAGEVEIGWRLAHDHWGQGYAREAALACLDWAWANLPVGQVAAITAAVNARSWGLMERIGMTRDPGGDFDHPRVADDDVLRRHVTYRIARPH